MPVKIRRSREITGEKQDEELPRNRDGTFPKGVTGNRNGRPRKKPDKKPNSAVQKAFDDAAEEITQATIDQAKFGNMAAAKIVIDRLLPPAKHRRVSLKGFPKIHSASDLQNVADIVLEATFSGDLTIDEANQFFNLLERRAKFLELTDKDHFDKYGKNVVHFRWDAKAQAMFDKLASTPEEEILKFEYEPEFGETSERDSSTGGW